MSCYDFHSKIRRWFLTHRCLSCGELEELTYVINKETSVFINMESFKEWDPDFIIMVVYSNSHLLSMPKLLQFDKCIKTPVSCVLFDVIITPLKYRGKCVIQLTDGQMSQPPWQPYTWSTGVQFGFSVLQKQKFLKGPTQLYRSIFSAAPLH